MSPEVSRSQRRLFVISVAFVGFLARVGLASLTGFNKTLFGDERTYWSVAQSLVGGGGFSINGVPTASVLPVYPLFVAAVAALHKSLAAVKIAQAALGALVVVLAYFVAKELGCPKSAALAAAAIAVYPPQVYLATVLYPQLLATLWVMLLFWLALRRAGGIDGIGAAGFGMLVAVGVLVVPMLVLVAAPVSLRLLRRLRAWVFAASGFLILMAPWTARNAVVFGRFIPLSTTGWMNFWAGNCEYTTPTSGSRPIYFTGEGQEISSLGELSASSEFRRRAVDYVLTHPIRTAGMWFLKFLNFWRPYPVPVTPGAAPWWKKALYMVSWLPVFLLSAFAAWRDWRRAEVRLVVASVLLFAAGYAFFFTRVRFRMPVEPLLLCFGTSVLCRRLKPAKPSSGSR